jgi:hypothetical protein
MEVREVQLLNAPSPILVTLDGMVMEERKLQLRNA